MGRPAAGSSLVNPGSGPYRCPMRLAFKEWAVVVDALEQGHQSVILRKGGIAEGPGGFRPEHARFLLFPTWFHQQRDQVIPSAQLRFDELAGQRPPAESVRITSWAEVVSWRKLASLAEAEALRGAHVWRDEVVAGRFNWGPEPAIYALKLQIFRLPQPWSGPLLAAYGGCKSWVDLDVDVPTDGSLPVVP